MNPDFDDEPDGVSERDVDQVDGAFGEAENASGLPQEARRALVTLLTSLFITRSRNRGAWDALLAYEPQIRERLGDMFMHLVIDLDMEVAFKTQDPDENAPRLLRRARPLSRDASFVLIYLRKEYAYADAQDGPVMVNRSQIEEFLRAYREEGDGDEAKFERRVSTAIRHLSELNLLSVDQDASYLFIVSPAVVPLVGPDELTRLEAAYQRGTETATAASGHSDENQDDNTVDTDGHDDAPGREQI
jgi:hypothetical protein